MQDHVLSSLLNSVVDEVEAKGGIVTYSNLAYWKFRSGTGDWHLTIALKDEENFDIKADTASEAINAARIWGESYMNPDERLASVLGIQLNQAAE